MTPDGKGSGRARLRLSPHAVHGVAVDEQEAQLNQAAADGADQDVVAGPAQATRQHAESQRDALGPKQSPGADGGTYDGQPLYRAGDPGNAEPPDQKQEQQHHPGAAGVPRGGGANATEACTEGRGAGPHQEEVEGDGRLIEAEPQPKAPVIPLPEGADPDQHGGEADALCQRLLLEQRPERHQSAEIQAHRPPRRRNRVRTQRSLRGLRIGCALGSWAVSGTDGVKGSCMGKPSKREPSEDGPRLFTMLLMMS